MYRKKQHLLISVRVNATFLINVFKVEINFSLQQIENEYVPENPYVKVTSVRVTKAWMANGNQDGIRPDSITVKLLADGKDTGKTLVLSSSNNWTGVFTGLDRYRDSGEEIVYTIEEVSVKGYESVITGSASAGFVVTNSHTHEETDLSGSKMWYDD